LSWPRAERTVSCPAGENGLNDVSKLQLRGVSVTAQITCNNPFIPQGTYVNTKEEDIIFRYV